MLTFTGVVDRAGAAELIDQEPALDRPRAPLLIDQESEGPSGRPENAKVRFFRKKVRFSEKKVRFTETTHRRAHDRQTAPHREEG